MVKLWVFSNTALYFTDNINLGCDFDDTLKMLIFGMGKKDLKKGTLENCRGQDG